MNKTLSAVTLALILINVLTLAFNIQPVSGSGTIYIRADGRVEGTTSIETLDNVTYFFVADINGSIVVERDNILLNGARYTLQGTGTGSGISLSERTNVTVQQTQITAFDYGLYISNCTNTTISGNNIVNNIDGIFFWGASSSTDVSENNITANTFAINTDGWTSIFDSNKIYKIYHNNFADNTYQRYIILGWVGTIFWNLSYPSGGNYWSDYHGIDLYNGPYQNESGSDGIGDTPYTFAYGVYTFQDYYPLMSPWSHMVGDVNFDGRVGLDDLVLLAKAYNSKPGDHNWNPLADIAPPYGIIGLTDLVTMAIHYGQHNP